MTKNSFILYDNYNEQLKLLSMEERGELVTAIFNYRTGEELPQMSAAAAVLFSIIKAQLERDAIKYDEMCASGRNNGYKGAEFGKLGGRPCKSYEEIIGNYNLTNIVIKKVWTIIQAQQLNYAPIKNARLKQLLDKVAKITTEEKQISYLAYLLSVGNDLN